MFSINIPNSFVKLLEKNKDGFIYAVLSLSGFCFVIASFIYHNESHEILDFVFSKSSAFLVMMILVALPLIFFIKNLKQELKEYVISQEFEDKCISNNGLKVIIIFFLIFSILSLFINLIKFQNSHVVIMMLFLMILPISIISFAVESLSKILKEPKEDYCYISGICSLIIGIALMFILYATLVDNYRDLSAGLFFALYKVTIVVSASTYSLTKFVRFFLSSINSAVVVHIINSIYTTVMFSFLGILSLFYFLIE